ncbi:MAG: FAD-binding protein, partial [Candidatus Bathyarchaeia archaeon]
LRGTPPPGDGLVSIGGRFYNALGERYMKKYDPINAEIVTRDLVGIRTYMEIKAGRGTPNGGVYNDLSGVPEEELNRFTKFLAACKAENIDPCWQPLEWAPGAHHFMGGVKINEKCETNVQRLYACGEVAGGVHGANRIGANALTDILVFGARAGRFAAESALSTSKPELDLKKVEEERKRIFTVYKREDGIDASDIRKNIQELMSRYVGPSKNESELLEALHRIEEIKMSKLQRLYVTEKTYKKLGEAIEALNIINVSEIIIKAALARKESRGAHYREDYQQRDDKNWLKNIIIHSDGNEMKLHTLPAILTELKPN